MSTAAQVPGVETDRGYVWTPERYAGRYHTEDWMASRPLLSYCLRYGRPGRVLDIGCGLGFFVECCRRWNIPSVGIEPSGHAVRAGRARGLPLAQAALQPGVRVPFRDGTFSVVVLHGVLNFVTPPTAPWAFQEIFRVLEDDGVLVVHSLTRHYPGVRQEEGYVCFYVPRALRQALERAGFAILEDLSEPRALLGRGRVPLGAVRVLYKLVGADWMTVTASFVCRKDGTGG